MLSRGGVGGGNKGDGAVRVEEIKKGEVWVWVVGVGC